MWFLKTLTAVSATGRWWCRLWSSNSESLQSSRTDAHFTAPNYHCKPHERKRWQYVFLKTYHPNSCQSFFSIVLMPIVHPTMKSSVTSAIPRKESCIYSHRHVKQQVNLMDISNINTHNERKNHSLLDPRKNFLLFIASKFQLARENHRKVRKIKRDMTKNSLDKTQLSLG